VRPDRTDAVRRLQARHPYGISTLVGGVAPAGGEGRLDAKIHWDSGSPIEGGSPLESLWAGFLGGVPFGCLMSHSCCVEPPTTEENR
jgi:hypothetical protein